MIDLLARFFVKDYERTEDPEVRSRYGVLAGSVGIFLNLCLFAAKFIAGLLTASIAVTADAFNNLSDAGSSVVMLIGFKMAGMPPDEQHPFGHGRIEYLSGLVVSMAIMLVGIELAKSSFDKILRPEPVAFSAVSLGILLVSVLVKLWMCYFNRSLGRRIHSGTMRVTALDSLTDAVATSAVLVGMLIAAASGWMLDGYIGILVAGFIFYTGINAARDSLSPLLGQAPEADFVQEIEKTVLAHAQVMGIHDLIIHDYGPGRLIISLHAEMPSDMEILTMHDLVDCIELELRRKYRCDVTIHMDPVAFNDAQTMKLRARVIEIVKSVDPALSIHDFRMVQGPTHTNLIFDVLTPHRFRLTDAVVTELVQRGIRDMGEEYFAVFRVEKAFI